MKWLAALALCSGCGRISFDPLSGPHDDGGGTGDARKYFVDGGECPPSYTFDTMGCYRAVGSSSTSKSWLEAETDCEADAVGAHLAIIDDISEVIVVDRQQPGSIVDHWIGMTDIVTDGVFLNVDNQPATYLTWDVGEPSAGDDCVLFNDDQTLASARCSNADDYVCEYDGRPPVPAAWGQ